MRKVFVIARHEYVGAIKSKAFLISVFLIPLLMGGGAAVQYLLQDTVDIQDKKFAVVDRTPDGLLGDKLQEAAKQRNSREIFNPDGTQQRPRFVLEQVQPSEDESAPSAEQRLQLSDRVRRGELFGFLDIGAEVSQLPNARQKVNSDRATIRYQSNSPTYNDFQQWASPVLQRAVQDARLEAAGLAVETARAAMQPVWISSKGLSTRQASTGGVAEASDANPAVSFMAPATLMILMLMLIFIGTTPAVQSVVEEKMQRISEMLLGSIRPFPLMMGKLMGLMGVSLTLAAVYLSVTWWAAHYYGFAEIVSPMLLAWFLAFLVMAIFMYGAMFIAVGAACSDLRETQTLIWPVMLVAMVPIFVWMKVAEEPNSTFAIATSFFPPATPMLMLLRVAIPPGVPTWQPVLGLILMTLTTLLCVYASGRIFRVGILMQGKGASLKDLARWIIRG